MELKKPLSFEDQLQKLKDHGVVISDESAAVRILKAVNYYRLTGYALQFRKDPQYSTYMEGTTFESIYHLYLVDS